MKLKPREITTINKMKEMGHRNGDKQNLDKQIINEDAKKAHLTRKNLTIDNVLEMAGNTKP